MKIVVHVEPILKGSGVYEYEVQVNVTRDDGFPHWREWQRRTVKKYGDIQAAVDQEVAKAKAQIDTERETEFERTAVAPFNKEIHY